MDSFNTAQDNSDYLRSQDSEMVMQGSNTTASAGGALAGAFADPSNPSTLEHYKSESPPIGDGSTSPNLNPRSCVTCRRRKVKCDKKHPCSNCNKAGIECLFPKPGRVPRRSKKPPDTELLARLRRLEGVVQSLGKGANGEDLPAESGTANSSQRPSMSEAVSPASDRRESVGQLAEHKMTTTEPTYPTSFDKEFGRLVIDEGKSRYVSNSFWASMTEEVAEMKDILNEDSDDDADYPSPDSSSSTSASLQGFIFSFSSSMITLRTLHPSTKHIPLMWTLYKENVDPLVRIFHKPTMERCLADAIKNLDNLPKATEALIFSIYFSVVTSISPDECKSMFGEEKDAALKKYRFGTEQALARANFLVTNEIGVLQALALFLVCVRRNDGSRFVWTMTGLAVRVALSMGLHRDGENFGLTFYEAEMRRRLWWQLCTLDIRDSEEQGSDPTIVAQKSDTRLPLNINDSDFTSDTKEAPLEHQARTEMTFDLIRYEVCTVVKAVSNEQKASANSFDDLMYITIKEKEAKVEGLRQHLQNKYLQYCDMNVPMDWVITKVTHLILNKMWLVLHHPFRLKDRGKNLPEATKERLFTISLEIIESSYLLEHHVATVKWGWLFHTYIQWVTIAYLLSELCIRTEGPEVEQAWIIVERSLKHWFANVAANKRGALWKPLHKLYAKARASQAKAEECSKRFPINGSLGPTALSADFPVSPISNFDMKMPRVSTTTSPAMPLNDDLNMRSISTTEGFDPFAPVDTGLYEGDGVNQWMNENPQLADPLMAEEQMNWEGWDDMMKDFQMQAQQPTSQGLENGPVSSTIPGWW